MKIYFALVHVGLYGLFPYLISYLFTTVFPQWDVCFVSLVDELWVKGKEFSFSSTTIVNRLPGEENVMSKQNKSFSVV